VTGKPRKGLSNFLRSELATPVAVEPNKEVPVPVRSEVPKPASFVVTELLENHPKPDAPPLRGRTETRTENAKTMGVELPTSPLYLQLTRKEVRFHDDQLEALDRLARRLQRERRGRPGERITENTLVRVAVAALLKRADELTGATEAELLEVMQAPPGTAQEGPGGRSRAPDGSMGATDPAPAQKPPQRLPADI
jgi:hypothetical protein